MSRVTHPCGPGLCRCDEADTCPACEERKADPGCDGLCEECRNNQPEPEPDDARVHDTWEEHRGER